MGRPKLRLQRADEWALNSIVAVAAAEDFEEFKKIRCARREVDPANAVSEEYYNFLVKVVSGLRAGRSFLRKDFDDWFASTCSSVGHKKSNRSANPEDNRSNHVRIPRLDRKGQALFADVLWTWVLLLRSKYVEVKWRYVVFLELNIIQEHTRCQCD